ncbi:hypothetical protein HNR06_000376 [Nocardiopsis arvandica]|uniref:Uncharacterized protein n=1 Tax=Nocardiopsis sinuspersici TaxID=501010 RepID=A0A7Y9X9C2_9ACTN|nr:hypothetical protein [Nocardiopsis sinuspersici]
MTASAVKALLTEATPMGVPAVIGSPRESVP